MACARRGWTLWVVGRRGLRRIRVGTTAVACGAFVLATAAVLACVGISALLARCDYAAETAWLRHRLAEKRALVRRQRGDIVRLTSDIEMLRRDMENLGRRVQELRRLAGIGELGKTAAAALPVALSDAGPHRRGPLTATALDEIASMRSLAASVGDSLSFLGSLLVDHDRGQPALPTRWPLRGRVSSEFGVRRSPYRPGMEMHPGIDIVGRYGAHVMASGDGRVVYAGWDGGYGRVLVIDHGGGMETVYAHLARTAVRRGERVRRGQVIAAVGDTGRATGAHLHYEVRVNGEAIDPRCYLR